MGLLRLFSKPDPVVQRLPAGSIAIDREARITATTVSSAHSRKLLQEVGTQVLCMFAEARKAQVPLTEFTLHFAGLQITAREMRGGALIFLTPKS